MLASTSAKFCACVLRQEFSLSQLLKETCSLVLTSWFDSCPAVMPELQLCVVFKLCRIASLIF
jgi:hypothetical protein